MPHPIVITTTSDDQHVLEAIGRRLVEDRLAACCQIAPPLKSIYRWDDQIETSRETQLAIKTMASRFDEVAQIIASMHNYDVPQIVAVDIVAVSESYAQWMQTSMNQGG